MTPTQLPGRPGEPRGPRGPADPTEWRTAAVVGAGTIGLSWAALFAAHGLRVRLADPRPDLGRVLSEALPRLAVGLPGLSADELAAGITTTRDTDEAVDGADLVQENGPERADVKRELFARIAAAAPVGAVLATSSSGIPATEIARDLDGDAAARTLVAHPFNPPHVVELVEIVPGERTAEPVVRAASAFYHRLGRTPVRLRREVPGFVANRLQSAVMRESIQLVLDGVVSVDELDTVMKTSLGARYATIGPFESFHLGGGEGGIRHMLDHLGPGMERRWQESGTPELTPSAVTELTAQTERAYGTGPRAQRDRAPARDRRHLALIDALRAAAGRDRH